MSTLDPTTKALAVLVLTTATRDFLRANDPKALAQAHKALIGTGAFKECEDCTNGTRDDGSFHPRIVCSYCHGHGILKVDGTSASRVETAPHLVVE